MQLSHTRHEVHTIDCRFMTFVLAYFCAVARPGWQAPAAPGFLPKVLALRSVTLPRHEPYSRSCATFETPALPSLPAVGAVPHPRLSASWLRQPPAWRSLPYDD